MWCESPFWRGLALGSVLTLSSLLPLWRLLEKRRMSTDEENEESEDEWEDVESECTEHTEQKMVLVVRTDLKMGKGKVAAQCAHAAVDAVLRARRSAPNQLAHYLNHGAAKVVVKVEDELQLIQVYEEAKRKGVVASIIRDAGRTQIQAGSKTVVAVGPDYENRVNLITGHLRLY